MPSRADFEKIFREADKDNSGELTFDELIGLMKKKGYRGPDSQIKSYFASVDTSGDNKISMQEFLVAMGEIPPENSKEASIREVFFSFDKDRNGTIDKNEMKQAFVEMKRNLSEAEIQRMMELVDKSGDGLIDYEEFIEFFFGRK